MQRIKFKYGGATCVLVRVTEDTYELRNLASADRRKGQAHGVLTTVTKFADNNELCLQLQVRPSGDHQHGYADETDLVRLYSDHGFKFLAKGNIMIRYPHY